MVKVTRRTINGVKYLIDAQNMLYNPDTKEEVGVYNEETKEIEENEETKEIEEDDFENEADWEEIMPFNLYISVTPGEDGLLNIYSLINNNRKNLYLVSELMKERLDEGEGKIEYVEHLLYPIIHNIKHKSKSVVDIEANFYVGYWGEQLNKDKRKFSFPLFWNGTINVGERNIVRMGTNRDIIVRNTPNFETIDDTDIDLTQPVGYFIIQLDNYNGDEEQNDKYDIADYEFEDRENLIRGFTNEGNYTIQYNKRQDVPKDIYNKFIKQQEEEIEYGTVTIFSGIYKNQFLAKLQKVIDSVNSVDNYDSLLRTIAMFDDFNEKEGEGYLNMVDLGEENYNIYKRMLSNLDRLKEKYPPPKAKKEKIEVKKKQAAEPPVVKEKAEIDLKKALGEFEVQNKVFITKITSAIEVINNMKIEYKKTKDKTLKDELETAKNMFKILDAEYDKFRQAEVDRLSKIQKEGKGIDNPKLYEEAKKIADETYKKPSAYKSGFIVKKYKELGGTYSSNEGKVGTKGNDGIGRWFKEEWVDIGNKEYPVYRPTKRISKKTPLTIDEIDPKQAKKQIALKQEIKGDANLPPFLPLKIGGTIIGQPAEKISEYDAVYKFSNPKKVQSKAKDYLGEGVTIFRSTKKDKKYMVYDKFDEKWVHFGQMKYEDFTKHQDEKRKQSYLARATKIKGNWKDNKYSPNNLSIHLLW